MSDRPNVLLVMSDQHSARCTSWGEYPEPVHTPNLDRLADEGVRFDRCFTQNPICTPSRTSFLSGQYASNHGYFGLSSRYGEAATDVPGLFDVAADLGYRTGAFGKLHVPHGLFDEAIDVIRASHASPLHEDGHTSYDDYLDGRGIERDTEGSRRGRPSRLDREDISEYWTTRQATRFIDDSDEPFCAWVSFKSPHGAYLPDQEFWDQYPAPEDLTLPPSFDEDLSDKPPNQSRTREQQRTSTANDDDLPSHEMLCRTKLRGYLGSISMVDDCLGRLLDHLERQGLREDTIVIYTSDHGDFALEHGNYDKAPGISYDAIDRIPFVWSWPDRFEAGAVRSQLVEAVDLFPTLAALMTDGRPVASADGEDLRGLLTGDDRDPVREYTVTECPWARSIRTADHRVTFYPRGFFGPDADEYVECYNYRSDPWEMTNLAVTDPDAISGQIERHRSLLTDHLVTNNHPVTVHPSHAGENKSGGPEPLVEQAGTIDPDAIREYLGEMRGANYL